MCLFKTDPLQDQYQLAIADHRMPLIMQEYGQLKSSCFQSFMENGKAISLPDQQLKLVAPVVKEYKYIPG